ncbi:MAG: hypothetical protein P0107_02230 [Nitrosomonas sp.]|nr:hypothetical protein [Nitrosomonas sp.]
MKEQSLSMKKNHNSTPVSSVCIVAAIMLLFYGVGFTQAKDFNTPPPNAPYQQPAFEGQTRAPIIEEMYSWMYRLLLMAWSTPGVWISSRMAIGL